MAVNTLDRLRIARYSTFQWRYGLSVVKKIALALGIAAITGLMAQARIYLPWTPVPITGQTFAALLAGVLLGQWWGGISMVMYAGLGIAGIPWFTGWAGGIGHLAGPTGGYIIGFILAAFFVGHFTDRYVKARKFPRMLGLMLIANFVLIYVPGLAQLYLWSNLVKGNPTSIYQVLTMGLFPFIAGDAIKATAVAATAWTITPKQAYGKELDREIE
jgi:biotin transport system substrate-specific component